MKITTKIALGIGVLIGYVLGRLKKGRWAIAVATFFAGRSLDLRALAADARQKLREEVPGAAKLSSP
ncbi:hypothetical protein [Kitasatospora terrestris]|uniref:DUF1490 domain-containing protein n=1 Tax=Kitasatospora terrestris TaxID=258051 RepID=A0ABP9DGH6_9ACTN